jgi:hypothetical protein
MASGAVSERVRRLPKFRCRNTYAVLSELLKVTVKQIISNSWTSHALGAYKQTTPYIDLVPNTIFAGSSSYDIFLLRVKDILVGLGLGL